MTIYSDKLPGYAHFWYCDKNGNYRRCQSENEIKDQNWKKDAPNQKSELSYGGRSFVVSTVFLGIDHNFEITDGSDPILFETMIFDQTDAKTKFRDLVCKRYRTWYEAMVGHREAVKYVRDNWRDLLPENRNGQDD